MSQYSAVLPAILYSIKIATPKSRVFPKGYRPPRFRVNFIYLRRAQTALTSRFFFSKW